jgi:hypothetical protein
MLGKFTGLSKGEKIKVVTPDGKGEKDFEEVDQTILNFSGPGVTTSVPLDPTCKFFRNSVKIDGPDFRAGDDLSISGFPASEVTAFGPEVATNDERRPKTLTLEH